MSSVSGSLSSGRSSAPARLHVHLTSAEKRVERERQASRQREQEKMAKARPATKATPEHKRKQHQLREEGKDRRLYCMALLPTGELVYGLLCDIRGESIGEPAVRVSDSDAAAGAGVAASAVRDPARPLSLADSWEHQSHGHLRWSAEGRRTVRQVLVKLATGSTQPWPADLVWRHDAFVPWQAAQDTPQEPETSTNAPPIAAAAAAAAAASPPVLANTYPCLVFPSSRVLSVPFSVRNCFESSPGYTLLSADYSNIELRLIGHFSRDPALVGMFHQDVDVLTLMASRLHDNVPVESITGEQRAIAKACVYAVLYGAGVDKVAQEVRPTQATKRSEAAAAGLPLTPLCVFSRASPACRRAMRCTSSTRSSLCSRAWCRTASVRSRRSPALAT